MYAPISGTTARADVAPNRRSPSLITADGSRLAITILAILTIVASSHTEAQQQHATFQHGDILAGGQTPSQIGFAFGRLDWFLPNGQLNLRLASTFNEFPQDVTLDRARRAYWPTGFTVRVFDSSGMFVQNFPGFSALFMKITFDRAGNAWVSDGGIGGNLAKVSPNGDLMETLTVPVDGISGGLPTSLDLAGDQCTLLYTSSGRRVFRYDVCRRLPLTDLNSNLPGLRAWTLRILPDGGVLISSRDSLLRLNNSGSVTRIYGTAGPYDWHGIALDVDQTSFWATSANTAYKFDIESGALLDSFQASDYHFNAITVVGEPRAALAGESIPTLSEWSLISLALGLAAVAVVRLRVLAG